MFIYLLLTFLMQFLQMVTLWVFNNNFRFIIEYQKKLKKKKILIYLE